MNSVQLVGRLTRDPEISYSNGGTSITRITLAVDRRIKQEGAEQTADFIGCVAFGRTAEFIEKYFKKGNKLGINGRIQTGSYTNKDNVKVYTTDVVIENCEFVESKGGNVPAGNTDANDFVNVPDITDEELPFN